MMISFLVMHLNLKSIFDSFIFFLAFVWMKFIFENKKKFIFR
jgi:hypothetical protein